MMKKLIEKIFCAGVITAAITGMSFVSAEAENYDPDAAGNITVQLDEIGTPCDGVVLECYHVADVEENDGAVQFVLVPELTDEQIDLNHLETASDHKEAAEYLEAAVEKHNLSSKTGQSDTKGIIRFTGLEQGVYLLVQSDHADYGQIETFLIAIPYTSDGNSWTYDVVTETKGELIEPIPTPTPVPTPTPEPSPSTGVRNSPAPYLAAAAVCGGLLVILLLKRYSRSEIR